MFSLQGGHNKATPSGGKKKVISHLYYPKTRWNEKQTNRSKHNL